MSTLVIEEVQKIIERRRAERKTKYKFLYPLLFENSYLGFTGYRILTKPHQFLRRLGQLAIRFYQRGKHGYGTEDVWNLDHYLLSWLPEALIQLKNSSHTHPASLTPQQWDTILREMIEGLLYYRRYEEVNMVTTPQVEHGLEQTFALIGKWFGHLWD